ncbi:MAG TPA: hypothetical protein VFC63_19200 [Blastocatellia bacterium]|nr:hypothetical protein [Blastocatellia bacterium]
MKSLRGRSSLYLCFILYFTVALLSGSASTSAARQNAVISRTLTYAFQPEVTSAGAVLHVTLAFQGNDLGTEEIKLPTQSAGQTFRALNNLRGLSTDTTVADSESPDNKTIHYKPNQPVVLGYDLVKDWTGPLVGPNQFHPVVMPEYLEIFGANSLVSPKLDSQSLVKVNFDWQNLPKDWSLATSFGTSNGADDRVQSYSGRWIQVSEALFAAGDFRIHKFQIGQRAAVLAIRSQWEFSDDQLISDLQKVIAMERAFWRDDNFPYFLIAVNAYDRDSGSVEGSGYTNAFWLYLSRKERSSDHLALYAHEAFHSWNVRRMGIETGKRKEIDWFHEGFTEYYAQLLVYRAGWATLASYLDGVNGDLSKFQDSNSDYVRGRIIGMWLDGEIRKESGNKKSLDNVMRDVVAEADKPLTLDRILETIGKYISADARRQLEQAVKQHGMLTFPNGAWLGECSMVKLSMDEMPIFDLGFDYDASMAKKIVIGVKDDGPAFKAGLRDGQRIAGRSINQGNTDKTAKIYIDTDQGRQTIEYYPRGKRIIVPQYHLDQAEYTANPNACKNP